MRAITQGSRQFLEGRLRLYTRRSEFSGIRIRGSPHSRVTRGHFGDPEHVALRQYGEKILFISAFDAFFRS